MNTQQLSRIRRDLQQRLLQYWVQAGMKGTHIQCLPSGKQTSLLKIMENYHFKSFSKVNIYKNGKSNL